MVVTTIKIVLQKVSHQIWDQWALLYEAVPYFYYYFATWIQEGVINVQHHGDNIFSINSSNKYPSYDFILEGQSSFIHRDVIVRAKRALCQYRTVLCL